MGVGLYAQLWLSCEHGEHGSTNGGASKMRKMCKGRILLVSACGSLPLRALVDLEAVLRIAPGRFNKHGYKQ